MSTDLKIYNNFIIENTAEEEDFIRIEGYCAHFNKVNLNNELVDESSFNDFFSLYNAGKLKPALNWNHDSNQIIGGIDKISKKENGLYMSARINKSIPVCEMIVPNILKGDITGLSTEGFVKNGYDGIVENEDGSYYVKDFILTAVAVTPTPADWNAKFCVKNYIDTLNSGNEQKSSPTVLLLL